jgi:hypothetical protein
VQPGTYYENLDFQGKNIVLITEDLLTSQSRTLLQMYAAQATSVILDGSDTGRVFTFDDAEDNRSVVAGFTIQNGNAPTGAAIYCYDTAAPTITHNIIRDNYASAYGGAIFTGGGPAIIDHNLICNNTTGNRAGALFIIGNATITNNTICGNSTEEGAGGLYLSYGTPTICNNIFWGNTSTNNEQELGPAAATTLFVTYSIVQGGFPGVGNLDEDPMFVDPANGDFSLLAGSPCIDAGDPSRPLDPDGTPPDIGAYYYPNPLDVDDDDGTILPYRFELSQNYPNPFNPVTTIEYNLPRRSNVTIEVYNVLGQKVRTLVDREESAGLYTITWNGTTANGQPVATGVYLYRYQAGDHVEMKKMLLLK